MGRVRCWYASASKPSTPGTTPFFRRSRARCSSEMLKGSCSMARCSSRLKTLGTCTRMVLRIWGSRSGKASPCCAWKLSRTGWRTASGPLVRPPSGFAHRVDGTSPRVFQDEADVPQGLVRRVVSAVSFAFLGCGRYTVGVPFLEPVAVGGEERAEVGVSVSCFRCAGAQQGGEFLFRGPDVMDEMLEGEVRWCSRVAGVALHVACLCRPPHGGGE